jgi:hypothetical protein
LVLVRQVPIPDFCNLFFHAILAGEPITRIICEIINVLSAKTAFLA